VSADTKANGDIFGGWLMAQMDLRCSALAGGRARQAAEGGTDEPD
jgi:acyl-CoA thioesterase YciA